MVTVRKDYIRRLIAGVRRIVKNAPENKKAERYLKGSVSLKWIDIILLCDVIEEDVLRNRKIHGKKHGQDNA